MTGVLGADGRGDDADDITLTGRGVYDRDSADLELTGAGVRVDTPLDFGEVPIKGSHVDRTVAVTNTGVGRVVIDPSWRDGRRGFELTGDPLAVNLDPGESVRFEIEFDPDEPGGQRRRAAAADRCRRDRGDCGGGQRPARSRQTGRT